MSPKAIIGIAITTVILIAVTVGGYFLFGEMDEVHQSNVSALEGFGSKVVPSSSREGPDGITFGADDGSMQLPPSLRKKKLSATEKVILALSRDKDELLIEIAELTEQFDKQQSRLQELTAYKAENERFAPAQLQIERERARKMLKNYFDNSSDVTHLSPFQLQVISIATANVYTEVVRQHQLILDDSLKDSVIKLLPAYGLCLSEPLSFVANDGAEERIIIKAVEQNDMSLLSGDLAIDFQSIHTPCLKQLNINVNQLVDQRRQAGINPIQPLASSGNSAAAMPTKASGPQITPSMSPTEQLIASLSFDKQQSLVKAQELEKRLARQARELAELKKYHDASERYAPLPTLEERNRAHKLLSEYFDQTPDANRFSDFEREAMSLSASNYYAALSKRHRLVLNEALKDEIINTHLPNYGFCFGDTLKFIIDNRLQQRQLINALREQDGEYMSKKLESKITEISKPCTDQLDKELSTYF
ncbi:MAG: hypothetical protein V7707_05570 [Motiliproteus sp.]